jgi:hypothetical protein
VNKRETLSCVAVLMSEKAEIKPDEKKAGINARNGRFQMQAAHNYVSLKEILMI